MDSPASIVYRDYDPDTGKFFDNTVDDYTLVDADKDSWGIEEETAWYVTDSAEDNVIIDHQITVTGDVRLVLCDDSVLTAAQGIAVPQGSSLTIYGQTEDTGKLYAHGSSGAGIGGYNIVTETISCGAITINGGTVTAHSSNGSFAAIGDGPGTPSGTVTINGGAVEAAGESEDGAAGRGIEADTVISITGGIVEAAGSNEGIYVYPSTEASRLEVGEALTIKAGPSKGDAVVLTGEDRAAFLDDPAALYVSVYSSVPYLDYRTSSEESCTKYVMATDLDRVNTDLDFWLVADGDMSAGTLELKGKGRYYLILCDGCTLHREIAVGPDATLTVFGQTESTGRLDGGITGSVTLAGGTFSFDPEGIVPENCTVTRPGEGLWTVSLADYGVTISDSITHGTVTTRPAEHAAGKAKVTVTLVPEPGYHYKEGSLAVTWGQIPVTVAQTAKNTFLFTMPGGAVTVTAEFEENGPVSYIDENGASRVQAEYTVLKPETRELTEGWYVADGNATISGRITVTGQVNLILSDGATLEAPQGVTVTGEGNSLTIYGQREGSGTLTIDAAAPVVSGSRVSACRGGYAKLTPCTAHSYEDGVCIYCGLNPPVSYLQRIWVREDEETGGIMTLEKTCTRYTVVSNSDVAVTWTGGWYVVDSIVTISQPITVSGDVHLILCDGAALTAPEGILGSGQGNSLTIYGQSGDTGALTATGAAQNASGIYVYTVVVSGGVITTAGSSAGVSGGIRCGDTLTVNGGVITATGGSNGAGILCSAAAAGVIINGGTVEATGGSNGAGIGGGGTNADAGSAAVTINGGTVTARSSYKGAGIGGGGSGGAITLGWTALTDSITAGSYSGTVTLRKAFTYEDTGLDVDPASMRAGATIVPKLAPAFMTHTLLLSGQIGVNFYADLSMLTPAEREAATMEFTVGGKKTIDTFDPDCTNPSTHTLYGFTCYINSVQMADEITAVLKYTQNGQAGEITQTYSAETYIDHVLSHTGSYSGNAVALVRAIADYGHYVQPFLAASNGWTVGTEHAAMPVRSVYTDTDVSAAKTAVEGYAISRDASGSRIAAVTYSLNLETETAIRIYLRVQEGYTGPVTAAIGNNSIDCVLQSDGRYRIEIGGISAHKLGDTYEITVSAGGEFTISVSALSYVNTVLNSASSVFDNDTAHWAVTSLYQYYDAAIKYKEHPNA